MEATQLLTVSMDEERLEHSRVLHILEAGRLLGPLVGLVIGLFLQPIAMLLLWLELAESDQLLLLALGGAAVALSSATVGAMRLRSQLLKPLVRLEQSVFDVCQGEHTNPRRLENPGVLGALMEDIDSLSDELDEVYEDMDNRVSRHTRRLAQQTAFLKVLYDVAAEINHTASLDALLMRFLVVLKNMLNGCAAAVSLITPEGHVRLVGSVDAEDRILSGHDQVPIYLCECGKALAHGDPLCPRMPRRRCVAEVPWRMEGHDRVETIEVPLLHHDEALGYYRVFVEPSGISSNEELMELLSSIGSHLGVSIAKHRSDQEARRLSIVQERTNMAHELHDSLAQTLASLRFQVRMLEDSLDRDQLSERTWNDVMRIRNGLDEAHTELRELLNSFLAPVEQRGLILSLEKLAQRFQQDSGIQVFFQHTGSDDGLSSGEELQILRIVQECLANIRKHAEANAVRVLLNLFGNRRYRLLVEDDGIGFDHVRPEGAPGEHIGLSIMEERARRLGGELRIESEPGEGTQVELIRDPNSETVS